MKQKLELMLERLRELMSDKGITPDGLGNAIGYGQINHWLSGDCFPSFSNMVKLADYFQCSLDYLAGLSNDDRIGTFKQCPPFSERLAFVLKDKNFTVYRFSKQSNIDKRTIYDWLHGYYLPHLDNLIKIITTLDCSIDYLIGRE